MRCLLLLLLAVPHSAFSAPAHAPPPAPHAEAVARATQLLELSWRQSREDHALALRTARESLALWLTTGDAAGAARAYTQVGLCHYAQSDIVEAIRNYEEALGLWQQVGDARAQAGALVMLAYSEVRRGEWASAVTFLTRAEGLVNEADDPETMGQIVSGLAHIFNDNGLPESALEYYRRAFDLYRRTPNPERHLPMALRGLGDTYRQLGDYSAALEHLTQALALTTPGSVHAAQCHHSLGFVFVAAGDAASALRHLRTALPDFVREKKPKEAAQVLALIGRAHELEGRAGLGRQRYREALAEFTRLSDRINQAAVLYALGASELRAGDYHAAEVSLRRSLEVTENIRRVPTSSDLTAAFSATVHDRYEKYIECLMRRHAAEPGRGHDARAYETSELARARSLAETLRATQTSLAEGLDPGLAAREKSLRQALRAKEDFRVTLLGAADKRRELHALDAELARLEEDYRRVTEEIRARHPAFEQATRPTAWDLRRIQEQVVADGDTVLLAYGLGETRSYVWAVTRDRLVSRELAPRARIDAAAGEVYRLLASPPGPSTEAGLESAARELGRLVLAPVAGELGKGRVVVVADGSLHYIPFQVLPARGGEGEPLVSVAEVVNAPSASVLGELRQEAARRRPAPRTLAAFGDPVFASNYARRRDAERGEESAAAPPTDTASLRRGLRDIEVSGDAFDPATVGELFYARRELAHLSEVAAGGGPLVASGFDATRERLLGSDLSQYAVLHFATHGYLDPRHPENSGLALSTVDADGRALEGFVTLRNVYALRAPVDLVVLSSCRTALGKDVRGEGLLGLTRGFMYAGASGVVSSLWKVDDEATAELMRRFYTNMLSGGRAPAAALREAQNEIRRRPEWRAPYYWAAFTLQGEYRQVIRTRAAVGERPPPAGGEWRRLLLAGVVCAALSAFVAAWILRRRAATRR